MITLVLTYRNRDLTLVKKCLDSLAIQTNNQFQVIVLDYGSTNYFSDNLKTLCYEYSFIKLVQCPTQGQLWNKARAINIGLKQSESDFFLVADIDMIFSPNFLDKVYQLKKENEITYFQVGFLSEEESKQSKDFSSYSIKHRSTNQATGITLYPTQLLMQVNGYDEFYHGWGSEDTDIHNRLKNLGIPIHFYDSEILLLHQWHLKEYRSLKSGYPFHSHLERINQKYMEKSKDLNRTKANEGFEWGKPFSENDYKRLFSPKQKIIITNEKNEFKAFVLGGIFQMNSCIEIKIKQHKKFKQLKNSIKRIVGKKALEFYNLKEANDLLLEMIIVHFRNVPYSYKYDLKKQEIILIINLNT